MNYGTSKTTLKDSKSVVQKDKTFSMILVNKTNEQDL